MKLNKLLPIVALSGIATVAMPLVTSCNKGGDTPEGEWDTEWDFKTQGGFESEIEPLGAQSLSAEDATNKYFDGLAENKHIMSDDWTMAIGASLAKTGTTINNGLVKVKITDCQKSNKSVSIKLDVNIDALLTTPQGEKQSIVRGTMNLSSIPFEIFKEEASGKAYGTSKLLDNEVASIDDMLAILDDYDGWKIASDIFIKRPNQTEGTTIKADFDDAKKPKSVDFLNLIQLINYLEFPSNYLQNITIS